MSVHVEVPISTSVTESNPDSEISGVYENGNLVITVDTREQDVRSRLELDEGTRLHWGRENSFEAQELSCLSWPIRYRVITREGYYTDDEGEKI